MAVLVLAACSTGAADSSSDGGSESAPPVQAVTLLPPPPDSVEQVVDGRTVVLSTGLKARVLGLAAPGQCFAEAALTFAKAALLGKKVRFSRASESVINLRLINNNDYAALAVSQGALRAEQDDAILVEMEKSAAQAGLGLWGEPCKGQDVTPTSAPPPPPAPTTTTAAPPAAQGCAVTYRVAKEWAGGFHAEVIVRNHTQGAADRWRLHWRFPSGQRISEQWGMSAYQYGPDVLASSPDGNGSIAAGGHVSIRFNAGTAGPNVAPKTFTLNGTTCSLT